jgi:hypothetical protein
MVLAILLFASLSLIIILLSILKIIYGYIYLTKDKLTIFKKKFQKLFRFSCFNGERSGSGSGRVNQDPTWPKDILDPDPQHSFSLSNPSIILAGEGWPAVPVGSATGKELNLFLYRWERGGVGGGGGWWEANC